jgi:hypothetical protein
VQLQHEHFSFAFDHSFDYLFELVWDDIHGNVGSSGGDSINRNNLLLPFWKRYFFHNVLFKI